MALRRTLSRCFFTLSKPTTAAASGASLHKLCRISDNDGSLRRLFQSSFPADRLPLQVGDKMMERICGSMRPDLAPPKKMPAAGGLSHDETRKVLRATQMEAARARLRSTSGSCISYSEFLTICDEDSSNKDGNHGIERALDESGSVIVSGDVVFVCPELITGAIESMISSSKVLQNDPNMIELKEMEDMKAYIGVSEKRVVGRIGAIAATDCRLHETNFLGAIVGCDGGRVFLRDVNLLHGRLYFLSKNIARSFFRGILPEPLPSETKTTNENSQVRCEKV